MVLRTASVGPLFTQLRPSEISLGHIGGKDYRRIIASLSELAMYLKA